MGQMDLILGQIETRLGQIDFGWDKIIEVSIIIHIVCIISYLFAHV